jgi:hypothetical protein
LNIVEQLKQEQVKLQHQLSAIERALHALNGSGSTSTFGVRRTMSAAARKRISLAQKARWAKRSGSTGRAKRTMSAEARRKISMAAKARWAARVR